MSDPQSHNDPLQPSQTQGQTNQEDPAQPLTSDASASATPPDAQEPLDPLAAAQAEVAILQAKVAELQDQFVRGHAEVQNARRRADEEQLWITFPISSLFVWFFLFDACDVRAMSQFVFIWVPKQ